MAEPSTWQDEHGGYPETDSVPHAGSMWPGFPPHSVMPGMLQHTLQETQMMDPLRFHWRCPSSSPFLPPHPHCLLEPRLSQDLRFMDPVNGQQSFLPKPWFPQDSVPSSMRLDFHTPEHTGLQQHLQDGTVELQSVDFHPPGDTPHQPSEDQLTYFMVELPQPMGYEGTEELVHPWESQVVFQTLENAQSPGDGQREKAQENSESLFPVCSSPDVRESASSNQQNQAACSVKETRGETSTKRLQVRSKGSDGERKPVKPCTCTTSKCLKRYCSCFSSGEMCSNCHCTNCHNNTDHQTDRDEAVKSYLPRHPYDDPTGVKGSRDRGCNCKHTSCLKSYCGCFKANIMCSSSCTCSECRNYDRGSQRDMQKALDENQFRSSVLPGCTVEDVCERLMNKAVEAEEDSCSHEQAERMILEEFGSCLSQICKTMFRVE